MGWKSKKDGTHFNDDKTYRDSNPDTEVNIEIDNNSDDFAEDKRQGISSELLEKIHDEEIRKSGHPENWSIGNPRIIDRSEKGFIFWQGGKPYSVHLDTSLGTISVDERYQDKNNKWHTGKNVIFAQGEEAQNLANDSGGWYVNTIMEYLDSSGVLDN